jgi:hypothetical protein
MNVVLDPKVVDMAAQNDKAITVGPEKKITFG